MDDCIFCKIVKKEIPTITFYEDDNVVAFMDQAPVSRGHALLVPKKHTRNLISMTVDEVSKLNDTLSKIPKAIKEALEADGIVVSTNNEKAAGQIVFHTHFHMIPRYENDGLESWPHKDVTDDEREALAEKIKSKLNS